MRANFFDCVRANFFDCVRANFFDCVRANFFDCVRANFFDCVRANFSTQGENTTAVQVVFRGGNALSKGSLLALVPSPRRFGLVSGLTIVYAFLARVLVLPSLLVLWARDGAPETDGTSR